MQVGGKLFEMVWEDGDMLDLIFFIRGVLDTVNIMENMVGLQ